MRRLTTRLLAVLLLSGFAGNAHAKDAAAQISPEGLNFVATQLPPHLPKSFTMPGGSGSWPCLSGSATNIKGDVQVRSMTLSSASSQLVVTAKVSVKGSLDAKAVPCVGPSVACRVNYSVAEGQLRVTFTPQLEAGKVKLKNTQAKIEVPESQVQLEVPSCGFVGTVANVILPHAKGQIVKAVSGYLEGLAQRSIPPEVESALGSFTQFSGSGNGFFVTGTLSQVQAQSNGLLLGADVGVKGPETKECTFQAAPAFTPAASAPSFSWATGEHLGLGISSKTVGEAVVAAWKSGRFCVTYEEIKKDNNQANVAAGCSLLGMRSVQRVDAHGHRAPEMRFLPGSTPELELKVKDYQATIQAEGQNGPTTVTLTVQAALKIRLELDPGTSEVKLAMTSGEITALEAKATDPAGLNLDTTAIKALLQSVVMPLLQAKLGQMELLPQILHKQGGILDPYYIYIARSAVQGDYLTLYTKLHRAPVQDTSAPSTDLSKQPGRVVQPGRFFYEATGRDGQIPTELLRYSWSVNDGAWSEVSFGRMRSVELKEGRYKVAVRAHDLAGNVDGTPAVSVVEVDGVAPTLRVTSAPPPVVTEREVRIGFEAEDDRSKGTELSLEVKAEAKPADGRPARLVKDTPRAPAESPLMIPVPGDGEYTVTLVARDEAGNVSKPVTLTFRAEGLGPIPDGPTPEAPPLAPDSAAQDDSGVAGGCSAGGRRPGLRGVTLLLLAACALLRSGRRRR